MRPFDFSKPQEYFDVSYQTALLQRCDTFQLKYDGWWCRLIVSSNGEYHLLSRSCKTMRHGETNPDLEGTYVGSWMFGTPWSQATDRKEKLFLFDCWKRLNHSCERLIYKERHRLLIMAQPMMPEWCYTIPDYEISQFKDVWKVEVENGDFPGVIFRKSTALIPEVVLRMNKRNDHD